jgi:hypothetical protein
MGSDGVSSFGCGIVVHMLLLSFLSRDLASGNSDQRECIILLNAVHKHLLRDPHRSFEDTIIGPQYT